MFAGLGRLVVRHPWKVIAIWVLVAIAVVATAPKLTSTADESAFLPSSYESIEASNLQQKAFPQAAPPDAIIVFERADGAPLTQQDSAAVTGMVAKLSASGIDHVLAVQAGPPPPNRLIQIAGVEMTKVRSMGDKSQTDAVKTMRQDLKSMVAGTDLKAGMTGTAAQQLDSQDSGSKADVIVFGATVLLILILLLVIFRSPVIALLPIVTILVVSQVASGLVGWASKLFDLKADNSMQSMMIVVLFGVGTDYILFLLFRYRERLRLGEDPKTAMVSSVTRVGEAIASAAGAVIIAFFALTLSTMGMFRALGPALGISVAVTLLAGLTLIPAVVSLLGTRVFWPSKAWRNEPKGARFAAIGRSLGKRPAVFAVASGGVLVALSVAALGFHPNFDLQGGSTQSSMESTVYSKELLKGVPAGATQPSDVYLQSDNGAPLDQTQLAGYGRSLAQVSGVGQVAPTPLISKDGTVADFRVTLSDPPASTAALDTVRGPLRSTAHSAAPPNSTAYVGGITAIYADIEKATNHDYAVVFPVAAVLIMIVLGLLLRSVVAPWYLMVSVGLGFGATLGSTVLIFQHLKGDPGVIFMLPVIMYLFVVALGTDYNILMVARLREEAREGLSPREAASMSLRHAGPTVAAAGVILAGSFASLTLAGNSLLQEMGFAISFGIAVAAFVMAMFFTPALTALIGRVAWWPGHADRKAVGDTAHREMAGTNQIY